MMIGKTKRLLSVLILTSLGLSLFPSTASARLIFTTEDDGAVSDTYHIDNDGSSTTFRDLAFGSDLSNILRFDVSQTLFSFNQALSLSGKELKNFLIDKQAADPATCDGTTAGRMYYKTGTGELVYCNGTTWTTLSSGGIADDSITGAKLAPAVAGAGLIQDGSGNLDVNVDGSTIEVSGDALQIKALGVGTSHLADGGVTAAKINLDVAGAGIVQNGGTGAMEVNADNTSLEVTGDAVGIKAAGVTESHLNTSVAGSGLTGGGGAALAIGAGNGITVNANDVTINADSTTGATVAPVSVGANGVGVTVDNSTIEHAAGTLQLKDGGIALAKIASREATYALTPEFQNFTLAADGTDNLGTMETDHDATTDRNFYKWSTKNSTTAQDYDMIIQWAIPENFQGWSTISNEIEIDYKTDTTTATDNQLNITLLDTAGVAATLTGGTALVSSLADTWVDGSAITFTGGTWTPGEYITLKIKMASKATSGADLNPVYIGQIKFNLEVK